MDDRTDLGANEKVKWSTLTKPLQTNTICLLNVRRIVDLSLISQWQNHVVPHLLRIPDLPSGVLLTPLIRLGLCKLSCCCRKQEDHIRWTYYLFLLGFPWVFFRKKNVAGTRLVILSLIISHFLSHWSHKAFDRVCCPETTGQGIQFGKVATWHDSQE
jgi:hypothetical protein